MTRSIRKPRSTRAAFAAAMLALATPLMPATAQHPDDPNEGLRLDRSGDACTVKWWAKPGRTYFIQDCADLRCWAYTPHVVSGDGSVQSRTLASRGGACFIRLRSTQQTAPDPARADFDGDRLGNLAEIESGTDPLDGDTDDDGIDDGTEAGLPPDNPPPHIRLFAPIGAREVAP